MRITTFAIIALLGASLAAQAPAPLTFDPARAPIIDRALQRYVDTDKVAGIVALVMQDGKVVYEKAFGWADKEAGRSMTTDTIFRIASQTKALTSAAVMQLIEEGSLALSHARRHPDSVVRAHVGRGRQRARHRDTGAGAPPITIRDLLTHTAGISYGTDPSVAKLYEAKGLGPAAGAGWYTADKNEGVCDTMERLGTLPFVSQPGESWVYGYNTDVLGCIVEKSLGRAARCLHSRSHHRAARHEGHAVLPAAGAEGSLRGGVRQRRRMGSTCGRRKAARGQGAYIDGPRRNFAGGAGLLSTARDYARFLEAMRKGGSLDGTRILSPLSVKLMSTNQVGTLHSTTGLGLGLGFETVDRFGANGMSSEGAFGWGGAYGSLYRVDPEARLVMSLMIQLIPNATDIREVFPTLVYQALR